MPEDFQDEYVEQIRDAGEVAHRCIVLYAVIGAGHGESRDELVKWLRGEGLWESVSPAEAAFLLSQSPTQEQRNWATWRAEGLFPLLWALGLIGHLPCPQELCDVQLIRSVLPPLFGSVAQFISSGKLRSDPEIHAANEEIYQIHWRVRDAQLRNQPTPPGSLARMPVTESGPPVESYNAGVVYERTMRSTVGRIGMKSRLIPNKWNSKHMIWLIFPGVIALVAVLIFGLRPQEIPPAGQSTMADVERLIRTGEKISAFRCYREIHNVGLAEAKKAVEDLEAQMKSSGKL